MEEGRNLAIFDFCDTIVNLQSADEFCKYVLRNESKITNICIDRILETIRFYQFASKLSISFFSRKNYLLRSMKGISKVDIEKYAVDFTNTVVEERLNKAVIDRLILHVKNNDVVILNSGGFEPYLTYFTRKYRINHCFSTRFQYANNLFTGKMDGNDCLGIEKVKRMHEADLLKVRYLNIYVYSDSVTDIPMFNLATHKVVVSKQGFKPNWCEFDFELITV